MLLAGGGNRLGGINKALIEIEGVTVISRAISLLGPLFSEIIIAGWPEGDPLPGDFLTVQATTRV
jgi:molybdopterin-guanine dinucleotide biosynthesis protein A